jgi:hypothetical protein
MLHFSEGMVSVLHLADRAFQQGAHTSREDCDICTALSSDDPIAW